ncbi:Stk1 family PASTA domain-containing Ser/Thr kinase [Mycetocola reblochoni]|uniref:non-specific serine/threonine protein kinase n=2 Tax=Mycetocola reblochoni TaxID=331618 RepID=A0A1R4J832_9MICO|nr:Stk1 family PASTA domain-containing Ser/Thr kinase [Mycetocola reblochoni]RLP69636.1 Stk1 family PASTA domain-containing Ser/Thr kinase [Mycetocola reblochoni]SJN27853.1 Probable serine/threonine-protein kinase pknL [Mycetocola reblochoni REB411]
MTSTSSGDPVIGRLIDDRYEVRSRIARGGMATVYLATDIRLERRVAIKVMHGHLSDDSTFTTRFIQEARSAARLAHPNVVSVFDQGQDDDIAYLVMEYLPGITLRELIRDHGRLTPTQVVDIMDAVTSGLAAAHRAGIVHRDLKPENVLLADDGRIKIGDFGLARAASAHTSTGQALLGTIAYLSPELVTRGVADARSDIYALGIMMYEMMTGVQPFRGEQPMQIAYQHANESVPRPSATVPSIPDSLDDLVLWTTEREPDERPADATVLLDRLREIEQMLGLTSAASRHTVALPPEVRQHAGDETQILTPRTGATEEIDPDDAVTTLTATANRRRRRGGLLLALVLALGGIAAGTGWYFGFGPGAQVALPELTGLEQSAAEEQLASLGLRADVDEDYSSEVAEGVVMATSPDTGSHLPAGSSVTLVVSQGARPVDIPALGGRSHSDATAALTKAGLVEGTVDRAFDDSVSVDSVVSARFGDDTVTDGGTAHEGDSIDLTLSAGALPSVVALPTDDARARLTEAGLTVNDDVKRWYSDTRADGEVIGISELIDDDSLVLKPGDSVTLIVSIGPEPVEVPDVVGDTISDAKKTLEDAGFTVSIDSALPQSFWDVARLTVEKMSPDAGEDAPTGSTITLTANI